MNQLSIIGHSRKAGGAGRRCPGEGRLLPLREVLARTSLSRSTAYREIACGRFPKPCRVSPGRVAWLEADIADWLEERRTARRVGRT